MTVQTRSIHGVLSNYQKVTALSFLSGSAISVVAASLDRAFASGFAVGYFLGVLNLLWLFRILRRGVSMAPERAFRYVAVNYYARFLLTVLVLVGLIMRGVLVKVWPPVVGLSLSIFASIILLVLFAREEV